MLQLRKGRCHLGFPKSWPPFEKILIFGLNRLTALCRRPATSKQLNGTSLTSKTISDVLLMF